MSANLLMSDTLVVKYEEYDRAIFMMDTFLSLSDQKNTKIEVKVEKAYFCMYLLQFKISCFYCLLGKIWIWFRLSINLIYHGHILQGSHNARDNSGEPLATSYHSKFMGTVDYIW